jgi:hypothetical protein
MTELFIIEIPFGIASGFFIALAKIVKTVRDNISSTLLNKVQLKYPALILFDKFGVGFSDNCTIRFFDERRSL